MVDGKCIDANCAVSHKRAIAKLEGHGYVVIDSWLADSELLQQYHDWHDPLADKIALALWKAAQEVSA